LSFEWVKNYVDIKGLAGEIMKLAKNVKIEGIDENPETILTALVLDEVKFQVISYIIDEKYREAKLELEKARLKKDLEKTNQWVKLYKEKLKKPKK